MTRRETDARKKVLTRDGHKCRYIAPDGTRCQRRAECIAHIIPQRKHLIKKYGRDIIHHHMNMLASCIEHNSYLQTRANLYGNVDALANRIREVLEKENAEKGY